MRVEHVYVITTVRRTTTICQAPQSSTMSAFPICSRA
jgi:hypothetical protein